MKLFWHLFKFNFIFNKVRLTVLTFLSAFIVVTGYYLNDSMAQAGSDILQYSSYVMFIILTGKMNLRNSMMFDIKQLQALPLSKREIVFHKSAADIAHFFPISLVCLYGFYLAYPEYHIVPAAIILHAVLLVANIVALNKRIDFARIQHSSTSFKNSFLYLNKYLDIFIYMGTVLMIVAVILSALSKKVVFQEYAFSILIVLLIFATFTSTVKMLKDETLSYFIVRRDIKRIGLKLSFLIIPLITFHFVKENVGGSKNKVASRSDYINTLHGQFSKYSGKYEEKKLLLSISQNEDNALSAYLEKHQSLPWGTDILGGYLPHIAAGAGNEKILGKLVSLRSDSVNMKGKIKKRTPIFTALRDCQLGSVKFLIQNGANINHQDINGDTPIMYAAQSGCYGGVLILKSHGANAELQNTNGEDLEYFVKDSGLSYYWENYPVRDLASEKKIPKK
jgi:hypothetical protein